MVPDRSLFLFWWSGCSVSRVVLREIITQADEAPGHTDDQLRFRLRALAVRVAPRSLAASA
jgi:hypothetical protein